MNLSLRSLMHLVRHAKRLNARLIGRFCALVFILLVDVVFSQIASSGTIRDRWPIIESLKVTQTSRNPLHQASANQTNRFKNQLVNYSDRDLFSKYSGNQFANPPIEDQSKRLPSLPGLIEGAVVWGDYDNDGRLDLFISGNQTAEGQGFSKLYRNTGSGFEDKTTLLPNLTQAGSSAAAWADYDNDGRLDLMLTGGNYLLRTSKLYHNTGSGFVEQSSLIPGLPQVWNGSLAWQDYDNDGRMDLLLTGRSLIATKPVTKLYRNTPEGFNDQSTLLPGLPGVENSAVAWGDYDNDGRPDLLLTGDKGAGQGSVSKLYHNTGSGFVDQSSRLPNLPAVSDGSLAWGDYDNDGRLDLMLTGGSPRGPVSKLYHNTGNGFEDRSNRLPQLPGVRYSTVVWGDYDNDGRLDLLLTGDTGSELVTRLYHNTGAGFESIPLTDSGIPNVSVSTAATGDYDNDGRLDLLLIGYSRKGPISRLFHNLSASVNTVPTAPTSLSSQVVSGGQSVTFSWQAATDAQTPKTGLAYNLYLSDMPGGQNIVGPVADQKTGYRRVVRLGNSQSTRFTITGLMPDKTYYWSVQAIDGVFAGSPFAPEQSFTTSLPGLGSPQSQSFEDVSSLLSGMPAVQAPSIVWGDYDNDGKLDLMLTGKAETPISKLYHNTGNGFEDQSSQLPGLPQVSNSSVAWADYDNDGRLDLMITGMAPNNAPISKLYHNTGNGFEDQTSLIPDQPQVGNGAVAFGDYDNDGRADFILTGRSPSGSFSKLYHNTGNGFKDQSSLLPALPALQLSAVAFGDYDNDGKLDLMVTGIAQSNSTPYVSKLYHNTGSGFEDASNQLPNLVGLAAGTVAWNDFDNDGRLDLLLTGTNGGTRYTTRLYRNTDYGFADASLFSGFYLGSAAWGDYDNDGLKDLLITGVTRASFSSKLYRNTGRGFTDASDQLPDLPQLGYSAVGWADYDNDGKLDVLMTGSTSSGNIVKLYHNISPVANSAPTSPDELLSRPSDRSAQLLWGLSTDAQTPQAGLHYNLYVSDTPGVQNVLSPLAEPTTGYRRVVQLGNSQTPSITLMGLEPGRTYYWSVQAIDGAFAGSAFAPKQRFTTLNPARVATSIEPGIGLRVVAYPNPVESELSVQIEGAKDQPVILQLSNLNGQVVLERQLDQVQATHLERLNLEAVPSGLYLLRVSTAQQPTTLKIIKQ